MSKHLSTCPTIRKICKNLLQSGWIVKSHNRHPRLTNGAGLTITVPSTPSDHRATLNWISQIRRLGVPVCC